VKIAANDRSQQMKGKLPMPTDTTPPHQPHPRRRPFRFLLHLLLRVLDPRDTLNHLLQLALGTLLVTLVDLHFLPLAAQQASATAQGGAPPPDASSSWPFLAIPLIVTVGWLILANLILRPTFAPSQPPHHSAPSTQQPTDSDGQQPSPRP